MYKYLFVVVLLMVGCGDRKQPVNGKMPAAQPGEQVATFAAGCFWATQEALSELKGVRKVVCAYAGGQTTAPTYEEVATKRTGHAEAVQVYYDPSVIGFADLTKAFFYAHDPTELDRQGPDVGNNYRSVAFYRNEAEKKTIDSLIGVLENTGVYGDIVTAVQPSGDVYPAEAYHQNYFNLNKDNAYIANVSLPKVIKMRKAVPQLLKPGFK